MGKGETVILLLVMCAFALVAMSNVMDYPLVPGSSRLAGNTEEEDGGSPFCNGMSMTMAMGGFQWSLLSKQAGDCISYFAPGWTLDNAGKFQGAMLYSFLLGIFTEGVHTFEAFLRPVVPLRLRHTTMALLYGFQRFFGYIVMLIAMTYTWELLLSAIAGLMVGHFLFPNSTRREWKREARRSMLASRHPTLATPGLDDTSHHEAVLLEQDPLLDSSGEPNNTNENAASPQPLRRRKQ